MYEIFGSVKSLIKLDQVCIDNNIFRLHYKFTVVLLMAFSILVTCKQYIGDPIDCIVDEGIPREVMDTFCWIFSTYTIPNRVGVVGKDIIAPGVASGAAEEDEMKHYKYYQWICFTLFFQAILFYIPRYLWKIWEGGKIKAIMLDLGSHVIKNNEHTQNECNLLADYFIKNLHMQNFYLYRFFFCEILNFINVLGQLFFIDFFLDGEFFKYGIDVIKNSEMEPEKRTDAMSRMFPKLTKCTFHKYGDSGSIEKFDGLCVLPLNIVNEKIYIFIWFWFIILASLTALSLVYRIMIIAGSKKLRFWLLSARSRLSARYEIIDIIDNFSIGDWFVLYQLGKNIDPVVYNDIISELHKRLEKQNKDRSVCKLRTITIKNWK